jgi:hypothetical protein
VAKEEMQRLGAVPFVPIRFVADGDAEFHAAVGPLQIEKIGIAGRLPGIARQDLDGQRSLLWNSLHHSIEPLLLIGS